MTVFFSCTEQIFDNNIFGGLFFWFLICNKKRPKCSLPYDIMANFLFPGKLRQIAKPIYFFLFTHKSQGKLKFSHVDPTSTWVGMGRMLPATLMSLVFHGFRAIWNTFGRIYGNQIQFCFHTFLYPLVIHFPSCFSFCVSENGTFSESVSHNNKERTIKLIQDIRMHIWTLWSHYYWMLLKIAS